MTITVAGVVESVSGLLTRISSTGTIELVKQGAQLAANDTLLLLSGNALVNIPGLLSFQLMPNQPFVINGQTSAIKPENPHSAVDDLLSLALSKGIETIVLLDALEDTAQGSVDVVSGSGGNFLVMNPLYGQGLVTSGFETGVSTLVAANDYEMDDMLFFLNPKPVASLSLNGSSLGLDESMTVKGLDANAMDHAGISDPFGFGTVIGFSQGYLVSASASKSNQPEAQVKSQYSLELGNGANTLQASDGSPIQLSMQNNHLIATSGSKVIFAIGINESTGQITVVQYHGLFHSDPDSSDEGLSLSNLIKVTLTMTDSSGDVSKASVDIGSKIIFEDDAPIINAVDQMNLTDASSTVGASISADIHVDFGSDLAKNIIFAANFSENLENAHLTSNGRPLIYQMDADHHVLTARTEDNATTPGSVVFTITLSEVLANAEQAQTPSYRLDIINSLDQPLQDILLDIPIVAIDADNDRSNGSIIIKISDSGDPVGGNLTSFTALEGDLDQPNGYPVVTNHQFVITAGSDRLLPEKLIIENTFLNNLLAELQQEVTAGGNPLTFTSVNNNGLITLTAKDGQGDVVFELKITPVNVGQDLQVDVQLTQLKPIDQLATGDNTGFVRQDGNGLHIDVALQAEDSDGDALQNPVLLGVTILDNAPPQLGQHQISFTENTGIQSQSGSVAINLGSDAISSIVFEDSPQMQQSLNGITSGGGQTSYTINGNEIILRINDPTNPNNGQELLKVVINTDGTYTTTLSGPLDQIADVSNVLLTVRATDKDGDNSNLGQIAIDIHDMTPQTAVTATVTLVEADLSPSSYPVIQTVSFNLLTSSDRLDPTTIGFDPLAITSLVAELSNEIKVEGQALTFTVNGNTITGSLGGNDIVVIELTANQAANLYDVNAQIKVTLNGPVDHNALNNSGLVQSSGDNINVLIGVQIKDMDEDYLQQPAQITVNINDGVNPALSASSSTLQESGVINAPVVANGLVNLDVGSDAVQVLRFNYSNGENSGIKSAGHDVLFEVVSNNTLKGYYMDGLVRIEVMEVTLQQTGSINSSSSFAYTAQLFQPLDHSQAGADNLLIPLKLIATDFDGDSVLANLALTVVDSLPLAGSFSAFVIEGQSVSGALTTPANFGSDGGHLYSVTVENQQYFFNQQTNLTINTSKGIFTIDNDGNWTLNSDKGQDHDFLQQLQVTYDLIDGDGDISPSATLTISIDDGAAPAGGQSMGATLNEADLSPMGYPTQLGSPSSLTIVNNGSDPFLVSTLAIQNQAALASELQNDIRFFNSATGQEEAVIATVDADSILLKSASGDMILEIQLVPAIQPNGDILLQQQVTLYQPLSHLNVNANGNVIIANDQISINYLVQVQDHDGDSLTNPVLVNAIIADGANPLLSNATTTLTEPVANGVATASGTMSLDIGSDPVASVNFDNLQPGLTGLTSNGLPTTTQVTADSIKVFDSNNTVILEVNLDDAAHYTVKITGQFDQNINNVLSIPLNVTALDKDGDGSQAQINLNIRDFQTGHSVTGSVTLVEGDLSPSTYPVVKNLNFNLIASSDRLDPTTLGFDPVTLPALITELSNEIKVQGQSLTFSVNGNTITGSLAGNPVIVIELTGNQAPNQYDFNTGVKITLNGPIDHNTTNNSGSVQSLADSVRINLGVQIKDTDGDFLLQPALITVAINDGVTPLLSTSGSSLGESGLLNGAVSATGSVTVDVGSDVVQLLRFNYINGENSGYKSAGHDVLFEVINNNILKGYYMDGATRVEVMQFSLAQTGIINSSGSFSYTAQLFKPLDHPQQGSDNLTLQIKLNATDADGDVVSLNLPITIIDSVPQVITSSASVIEGNTVSGVLTTGAGYGADGGHVYSVTVENQTYSLDQTSSVVIATSQGTLTVNQNGSWTLVSPKGLDHDFNQQLAVDFKLIDNDGDISSPGSLVISVLDGAASTGGQTMSSTLNEGDLSPLTYPVSLAIPGSIIIVNNGSDPFVVSTLAIQNQAALAAELQTDISFFNSSTGLQESVVATVTADSILLKSAGGQLILDIQLTPTLQGNGNIVLQQQVTLYQPLSHLTANGSGNVIIGSDQIRINYQVQIQDHDGDSLISPIVIGAIVADGINPDIGNAAGSLSESALSATQAQRTSIGNMPLDIGSDPIASLTFNTLQPGLTGITSNGFPTTVQINGNFLTVLDHNNTVILTVTLDNTGHYVAVASGPMDQSVSNVLSIPLNVTVTDKDGDSDSAILTLSILDSLPAAGGNQVNLAYIEGNLSGANAYPVSDVKTFTVIANGDRLNFGSINLVSSVVSTLITELQTELKSAGQNIVFTYDSSTHVLTGKIGTTTVLTLAINATQNANGKDVDASITVTQYQPLDHSASGNSTGMVTVNGQTIQISTPLQINDSDGDLLTNPITVTTTITDGAFPVINPINAISVKESDLGASTGNHQGSLPAQTGEIANGQITVQQGSDKVVNYSIDTAAFNNGTDGVWRSGGQIITLTFNSATSTYTGSAAGVTKFTLKLNADGSYTFTLVGSIDHPTVQGKNTLDIIFSVIAQDADADVSALAKLPIRVEDDVPSAANVTLSTIIEGATTTTVDIISAAREGADTGKITSVWDGATQYNIVGTGYNSITIYNSVNGQALGQLEIRADGSTRFFSNLNLDHDSLTISKTLRFDVTDADGDTATANIVINITDKVPVLTVSAASGNEDVGRDANEVLVNPQAGIPINMAINIGDFDNGETIGKVLIQTPAQVNGQFFYNGVALTTTVEVGITYYVIPPAAFITGDNVNYTLSGLTFVPNADFSSYSALLSFPVRATIYQQGDPAQAKTPITGTLAINVSGIADAPVFDMNQTVKHYQGTEDSTDIALQLKAIIQDNDGSEVLNHYIITITEGQGTLIGDNLTQLSANSWQVNPADIGSIKVNPADNFSGDIKLDVVAQSRELGNFIVQTANSAVLQLVVNVLPVADPDTLKVTRIDVAEDTRINLGQLINLTKLNDNTDGSEIQYLRLSDLPDGAIVYVNNVAQVPVNGVYEIPYSNIGVLTLQPPPESNVDFTLKVTGVVKDTAIITNPDNSTSTVVDEYLTPIKIIEVGIKGVADQPLFNVGNTGWTVTPTGVEITALEDTPVRLNFSINSGEDPNKAPSDTSETLSVVLTNIPPGTQILDSQGNTQTLTYVGLDSHGNPQYEVQLASLDDLFIVPPLNSTQDITINAKIFTTENDGNVASYTKDIVIHYTPAIDAVDYSKTSRGLEDQSVNVDWRPTNLQGFTDSQESITHLSIENVPVGYSLYFNNVLVPFASPGVVDFSSTQLTALLAGGQLQLRGAPEDSDVDVTLISKVTVTQNDVDSANTISKVITGTLNLDIQAVVEPDGQLQVISNGIPSTVLVSDSSGNISLPVNPAATNNISFIDNDPSSNEVIKKVVISFEPGVAEKYVVIGGIHDGGGNWTVPESQLGNLRIISSDNEPAVHVRISAQIQDLGDNGEGDVSALVQRDFDVTLDFSNNINAPTTFTADLLVNSTIKINGQEDTQVSFGSQLASRIKLANGADLPFDEFSIVIKGSDLPAGTTISGMEYDFVHNLYLLKATPAADGTVDLSSIKVNLPVDFAGDFILKTTYTTTDTVSGDTQTFLDNVPVVIRPVVDVPTNPGDANRTPQVVLNITETRGLNADKQPLQTGETEVIRPGVALEDGVIKLNLAIILADIDTLSTRGLESISSVTLTVNPAQGSFVDFNGLLHSSITLLTTAQLNNINFKPAEDYAGNVAITTSINILDIASYDETGGGATASGNYTTIVNLKVDPVNDAVTFVGTSPITGSEEQAGGIPLTSLGVQLNDMDGSESIVSVIIGNVPTDFVLGSPAKNIGGGEWKISVPANSTAFDLSSIKIIPPKDFSGSVDLTMTVFTKEALALLPEGQTTSFTLVVNPVGDRVDSDINNLATGAESAPIDLILNVQARDLVNSYTGNAANVHENAPEHLLVTLSGIPIGGSIQLPTGVSGTVTDMGSGVWQVLVNASVLPKLEFLSGNANGAIDIEVKIQGVDNGVVAAENLATIETIHLDVTAVNNAPVNVAPASLDTGEDQIINITTLQVTDIDAREVNGDITVSLEVQHGLLNLSGLPGNVSVTGAGSMLLTLTGNIDDINALLSNGIQYQGDPDFNGSDALTMTTNDNGNSGTGGALQDIDTIVLNVDADNDAPVNTMPAPPIVAEDQSIIISGLQVIDVDAIASMVVTLEVMHGTLSINGALPPGVNALYTPDFKSVTLTGSLTDLNSILASSIQYQGDANYHGSDSLKMTSQDQSLSDIDSVTVTVTPVNDAPINTLPGVPFEASEDQVLLLTGLQVTDVDAADNNGNISVALEVSNGTLSLAGMFPNVVVTGDNSTHLLLVGQIDDINALLATGVNYLGNADYHGQDLLKMTTDDNANFGAGGSLQDFDTTNINVNARADSPELQILYNSITAALGVIIPLNISADVVNPVNDELSVKLDGLGNASLVDAQGQPIGTSLGNGSWEIAAAQLPNVHVQNLDEGQHTLTITAVSDTGDNQPLQSVPQTVDLTVVDGSLQELQGQNGTDLVLGSDLGNTLRGIFGDDVLVGGAGNDLLIGGAGNDTLTGGAGSDVFKWEAADHGIVGTPNIDVITDFNPQEDKIDLTDLLQGEHNGNYTSYMHLEYDSQSNNTLLSISSEGHFDGSEVTPTDITAKTDQQIVIHGVDLVGAATNQAEIITQLFAAQQVVADT